MLAHPPAAIVAAGGTGELYSLTPAEHLEVVRTIVEECSGRVPVIAGVGFNASLGAVLSARRRRGRSRGHSRVSPVLSKRRRPGRAGLLPEHRGRHATGPFHLQPRLVSSRPALVEQLATIPTLIAWKEGQGDIRRLQISDGRRRRPSEAGSAEPATTGAGVLCGRRARAIRRASRMSRRGCRWRCTSRRRRTRLACGR